MTRNSYWYKDAVMHAVYVRAFCDSNGDGHGDIAGLISKLDYLKNLGGKLPLAAANLSIQITARLDDMI